MPIKMTFTTNIRGFTGSIRALQGQMVSGLSSGLKDSLDVVANNVRDRLEASIGKSDKKQINSLYSEIKVSNPKYDGGTITVGVGNVSDLDKVTEVITKGEGKAYSLWRLLEYGFGKKGGTRSDLYEIRPVAPKKALAFYNKGNKYIVARVLHPGAYGKHFFRDMDKNWYNTDVHIVRESIYSKINSILTTVNYKG